MRLDFRRGKCTRLVTAHRTAALRSIIDFDAGLARVAAGMRFTEGPVWNVSESVLFFSDIPANRIYELHGQQANVRHEPSNHANGLAIDNQGRLLACEHGARRVSRRDNDGEYKVLAHSYEGARLNSPNDIVVASDGAIWFTDPPYGIRPEAQELPFQGVFRLDTDGVLHLASRDFDRPNGLAFSPDQRTLYVADSSKRRHIRAFSVSGDSQLTGGNVFVDMSASAPGVPDGFKVSADGVMFSTGPAGIWVIDPTGKLLGIVVIPETTTNCAFGDPDGRGLYVTASTSVYRLRLR